MTYENGITEYSAPSCAFIALILSCVLNDHCAGRDYAEYAVRLVDKFDLTRVDAPTSLICYGLVLPWSIPIRSILTAFA